MKQRELLRKIYWISAALVVVIVVFLVSVFFLNPTSVGNPRFVWMINFWAVFWALNFVIVLVLSFLLARNLIKLFFEFQAARPGSRIETKLVVTLIIFSLFPALIMAFLAFGLINQNLRQWFSSPAEQLLESSGVIARRYYEQDRRFRLTAAQLLAQEVAATGGSAFSDLLELSRRYGFRGILLVDAGGAVILRKGEWSNFEAPGSLVEQVLGGQSYYSLDRLVRLPEDPDPIVDHGIVGVPLPPGSPSETRALFLDYVVPESVAFHAVQVGDASEKYEAIKQGADQLQLNYFSVLGLTTLAVVFGFVWLGTYIARKITVPLEALAEGSRELAEGNLDYRVGVRAVDELGILVDSFNQMAEDIKQNRQKLERANAELREINERLDERRRYIETILQNIATGVISIDESNVIRAVNEASLKMLQLERDNILNRPIREVADPDLHQEFLAMKKRARLYGTCRKEVTFERGDRQLHVAATMTCSPLAAEDGAEYLVVLDDLTELIKAEKFAAWQEVARRLAHEIKNPLTPIQLSAERVKKRFEKVAAVHAASAETREFQKVLGEAMRIIVQEAEMLRALVEEFSKFARLPMCRPAEVELHGLIDRTLTLYDGSLERVQVRRVFDPRITRVRVDPEQIQRVFINLIDNSLAALAEAENPYIQIRTWLNERRESVTVELEDNGIGIEPQDYEHLFLPYFSRKKKGTGLGLAIVRQIISEHNGFVRAEPNRPRGTRFIMELPVSGPHAG